MEFDRQRRVALHILTRGERLSRRAGAFLGQLAVDAAPLSHKQLEWLSQLAERAGVSLEDYHG